MSWLDKFITASTLVVASSGVALPVEPTLNFLPPMSAADNPSNRRIDVSIGGALVATAIGGGATANLPLAGLVSVNVDTTTGGASTVNMPAGAPVGTIVYVLAKVVGNVTIADPSLIQLQDPDSGAIGASIILSTATPNVPASGYRNICLILTQKAGGGFYWATL
jgi:hypothetical protein